jgi:predicted nucleotidyltransferase
VYIFGSYAKSNYTDDSDIDVAVIVENELRYDEEIELMRRRRNIDLRIEPHLFTTRDFQDGNPLTEEIKRTGFKIQ